jgi:hypothetical protein
VQASRDLFRFEGIRKQELHGIETGRAGGGEAVEEIDFVEKQAQVGGKFRHCGLAWSDSPLW